MQIWLTWPGALPLICVHSMTSREWLIKAILQKLIIGHLPSFSSGLGRKTQFHINVKKTLEIIHKLNAPTDGQNTHNYWENRKNKNHKQNFHTYRLNIATIQIFGNISLVPLSSLAGSSFAISPLTSFTEATDTCHKRWFIHLSTK